MKDQDRYCVEVRFNCPALPNWVYRLFAWTPFVYFDRTWYVFGHRSVLLDTDCQ